jgi:hypothetical protein
MTGSGKAGGRTKSEGLIVRDQEDRITIFGGPGDLNRGLTSFEGVAAGQGIIVSAWRSGEFLDRVVLSSEVDPDVQILNTFRTRLIAVSDDVKTGRFGDFIQKVHSCARGDWLKVSLRKGVTYTITSVL